MATLEEFTDLGVGFETLELLVGVHVRVVVVKADDHADVDVVGGHVV